MAKKYILAFIIIIVILAIFLTHESNSINVYIDGENVTTSTQGVNSDKLNAEICDYTLQSMNSPNTNIDTLKSGIENICLKYDINTTNIQIDSTIGKNSIL